jgi:DNA-binding response OmpR family regulator
VSEQARTDVVKVLVVSDDPGSGDLLTRLLVDAGWPARLTLAPNAVLVELDAADPPVGAVVLDLDGDTDAGTLKTLTEIRGLPGESGQLPVVACVWDEALSAPAWMSGVDAVLVRAFHADDLLHALDEAVHRPSSERVDHRRRQQRIAEGSST